MAPARFDAAAPPTRESVTDTEGLPTTGSDPFKFMVWLAVVEDCIKTANPNFFELYTTGRITTHKHTVVASAEHATELSTTVNPTIYTFANPAPAKPRSTTAMPDDLKSEFSAQPDLLTKYDHEGFNTIDKCDGVWDYSVSEEAEPSSVHGGVLSSDVLSGDGAPHGLSSVTTE